MENYIKFLESQLKAQNSESILFVNTFYLVKVNIIVCLNLTTVGFSCLKNID